MKSFWAFTKKELLEQVRTGRLLIFIIIFCIFGIMNPAIAKITPWLMETMSDGLAESGFTVTHITVDAMTSWTQFYKNVPILLIIFLIMFSGILTGEYQKGTMINIVTKGLKRWKIIISKLSVMSLFWTAGFLLCYAITYGYNAYFWDNGIAEHIWLAAFCFYLAGLWLITLIPLASSYFKSSGAVFLAEGGIFALAYLICFFPAAEKYSPAYLSTSSSLLASGSQVSGYFTAIAVTAILMIVNIILSVISFNRKYL